jgi:anti-sigma regulatory factor (Ser/Thr protein kinase)
MVLYLPRDAATGPVSRQVLDGCLETLGVMPDTRADIALALGEACANVIRHAGAGEEYQVQVTARNGRCAMEVVDAGSGDGKPAPDGSGTRPCQRSERPEPLSDGGDVEGGLVADGELVLPWPCILPGIRASKVPGVIHR